MRAAFIASFLANVLLALLSLLVLPERVAIHFDLGGLPDSWASDLNSTLLMLTVQAWCSSACISRRNCSPCCRAAGSAFRIETTGSRRSADPRR
jgi:putative effector of murein hydrolase LrgA (UPF0299 family)